MLSRLRVTAFGRADISYKLNVEIFFHFFVCISSAQFALIACYSKCTCNANVYKCNDFTMSKCVRTNVSITVMFMKLFRKSWRVTRSHICVLQHFLFINRNIKAVPIRRKYKILNMKIREKIWSYFEESSRRKYIDLGDTVCSLCILTCLPN